MEISIEELKRDFPYELGIDMKYLRTIDHGAFGTVLHVLDLTTNKDMAVKVINKNATRYSHIDKMKEEVSILRILSHPNIVKFYGYIETTNQLLIKMEYIKYGSLKQWIKKRDKISEEEASIILKKILSAIEYLHSKQICHRDIKPENIMLSEENDLNSIKIIDFGLSAQNFDLLINNDYCGTYIYMAPELIEKKLYFNSVDMWSIGILMFILLNKGKHPFYVKGDTKREIAKKIKIGKINFYEKISPMAKHLILKLLEPNPSWRYTAIQAIKHPWITRNVNDIPPKTFNEILIRSNNIKILKDLFNTCLFMNFFLKRENFKYLINKKYIQKCAFFSEKNKIKMDKKRERCLNVNTVEDDENNKNPYTGDYDNTKRGKTKEKCFSLLTRNRGKSMKFDKMPKLTFDKRSYKKSKTNGVNDILKKYQSSKIKLNKFKLINQNNILINASRRSIKKSTSQIYKFEKARHYSIKNYETLTANKNNSIYIYKKINEDSTNEKNNEDFKIKPISSIQDLEKAHKIYQNLSSKKLRNFPKLGNMKKINLFQRNSHISLNNIENSNGVPLILPNLGKLGKTKEKNEKILTKTFMKVQTIK